MTSRNADTNSFENIPKELIEDRKFVEIKRPMNTQKNGLITAAHNYGIAGRMGLPKTDCGLWLFPSKIFRNWNENNTNNKGIPGQDLLPPPPGWLHSWSNFGNSQSPIYLRHFSWSQIHEFRSHGPIPLMIEKLKKLWTPPPEFMERARECSRLFPFVKKVSKS